MKKTIFLLYLFFASTFLVFAKSDPDSLKLELEEIQAYQKLRDSVNNAMNYETGVIQLKGGIAKLNIPKGFKYLGIEQSRYVIQDIWGNPERDDILGMIFPETGGPLIDSSYAFIISFDDMGYVKDDDAGKINYQELLDEMHKEEPAMNTERQKQGYPSIHMVGWAQPPFYDSKNKILHWAKELQFSSEDGSTLNYDVRFLGRKGILSFNAVATMDELPIVKNDINQILNIAEFTEGNRYADFDSNTDKIAAYTVGGLVAGKILLKIGFFAKFWKLILLAVAGIGAWVVKLIRKKKEPEMVYDPAPSASTDTKIPS
jgi:uncharacterized membrane-anchored protein